MHPHSSNGISVHLCMKNKTGGRIEESGYEWLVQARLTFCYPATHAAFIKTSAPHPTSEMLSSSNQFMYGTSLVDPGYRE